MKTESREMILSVLKDKISAEGLGGGSYYCTPWKLRSLIETTVQMQLMRGEGMSEREAFHSGNRIAQTVLSLLPAEYAPSEIMPIALRVIAE